MRHVTYRFEFDLFYENVIKRMLFPFKNCHWLFFKM